MPFLGVLAHRRSIFQPEPVKEIAVNDVGAWRLNPDHRYIYNKLQLALAQGLLAAPCGVDPLAMGVAAETSLFIKPIVNLAGMALDTSVVPAQALAQGKGCAAGRFWCEYLQGEQSSTDCLVLDGEVMWFAHTCAASQKNRNRPLYWHIGADMPHLEPGLRRFVAQQLAGYTGLCNLEMIAGQVIEVHLRGSNAFFDFYGQDFIAAWVSLVDEHIWQGLEEIPGGYLYSVFAEEGGALPVNWQQLAAEQGVVIVPDALVADRLAIIYSEHLARAVAVADDLLA